MARALPGARTANPSCQTQNESGVINKQQKSTHSNVFLSFRDFLFAVVFLVF